MISTPLNCYDYILHIIIYFNCFINSISDNTCSLVNALEYTATSYIAILLYSIRLPELFNLQLNVRGVVAFLSTLNI